MFETKTASDLMPPYPAFNSLKNFITGLKGNVPQSVDKETMLTVRDWERYQLLSAMRFLALIDEKGIPQESFIRLVRARTDSEWQQALRSVLETQYSFVFKDGFSLATGTTEQLGKRFESRGMSGDTIRKSTAFLLNAARDAGMPVSPSLKPTRMRRGKGLARNQRREGSNNVTTPTQTKKKGIILDTTTLNGVGLYQIPDLPPYDASWGEEFRLEWIRALNKLLDQQHAR